MKKVYYKILFTVWPRKLTDIIRPLERKMNLVKVMLNWKMGKAEEKNGKMKI